MPAVIRPSRSMADVVPPAIPGMHTRIIGPFNDHHAADNGTGAMNNMVVNDDMPVVSTPAVPMPSLGGRNLGKRAKEDRA